MTVPMSIEELTTEDPRTLEVLETLGGLKKIADGIVDKVYELLEMWLWAQSITFRNWGIERAHDSQAKRPSLTLG